MVERKKKTGSNEGFYIDENGEKSDVWLHAEMLGEDPEDLARSLRAAKALDARIAIDKKAKKDAMRNNR